MTRRARSSIRATRRSLAIALIAALPVIAVACGGTTHTKSQAQTTTTRKSIRQALKPLPRPLLARCGTAGFAKPHTAPYPVRTLSGAIAGWQVAYQVPLAPGHVPAQGQTLFTAIERAATGRPARVAGGRDVTIAGRKVNVRNVNPSYVAAWETGRGRYLVLASNISLTRLERLIGCLP